MQVCHLRRCSPEHLGHFLVAKDGTEKALGSKHVCAIAAARPRVCQVKTKYPIASRHSDALQDKAQWRRIPSLE